MGSFDKLSGGDLFCFLTMRYDEIGYKNAVSLLPHVSMDIDVASSILKRCHDDDEFRDTASLLLSPAGECDIDKALSILKRIILENKNLFAIYPSYDNTDTYKMEFVDYIDNGYLYLG